MTGVFFSDGPSIEVCLPVGDMINHAPAQKASVEVQYHETSKMMCFQTTRQLAAGEEHLGDDCWWRKSDVSVCKCSCLYYACIDLSWLSYDLIISEFAEFPQFVRQLRILESDTSSSGKHQQGYSWKVGGTASIVIVNVFKQGPGVCNLFCPLHYKCEKRISPLWCCPSLDPC